MCALYTLQFDTWFEYVRSAANIADLPSREGVPKYGPFEDTEFVPRLGSVRVEMRMPPMSAWDDPFGEWIAEARAAEPTRKRGKRGKRSRGGASGSA